MALFIFICVIFFINLFIYIVSSQTEDKIEYYRDIPSNEAPAVIGLMVKENIDGNDIVATLLDLNTRGFIDITYDINNRSILRLTDKERFMVLKDYETYLLDQIFMGTNEVVFDDFVASDKFRQTFRVVGDMIKKRVDIASTHKLSHKKNYSKINFLTSYILFSFSLIFPIVYLIFKDNILIPLLISYGTSYIFISIYKMLIDDNKHKLDNIILYSSITISVIVFGLFIVLYLVNSFNFEINTYINIGNIILSFITIITIILINKSKGLSILDLIYIGFSIISIFFNNYIGIMLGILYLSRKIYLIAPEHKNLKDSSDIDKWKALKKFLDDFTLIKDREAKEVSLWDKYLIYGISMGVNKKTIREYSNMLNLRLINDNFIDKYYSENIDY